MRASHYFATVSKNNIIWGVGKTERAACKRAENNLYFADLEDQIQSLELKTYKISPENYKSVKNDGFSEDEDIVLKNGFVHLVNFPESLSDFKSFSRKEMLSSIKQVKLLLEEMSKILVREDCR